MTSRNRPTPPQRGLWTAKDVAAVLQKSRSWVYHAALCKELPCRHIGCSVRFEPQAIYAWIAQQ